MVMAKPFSTEPVICGSCVSLPSEKTLSVSRLTSAKFSVDPS